MKPADARKMTSEELDVEITRLKGRSYTLRSQSVTEKVEDTSQFGKVRKDIARLITEKNARQAQAAAR